MEHLNASSTEYIPSRKNSASDLVSRLKTRKVLGVGGDDGDIYRSKISQILGPSEHLYVKMPKVLIYWQNLNTIFFFTSGLLLLIFPKVSYSLEFINHQTVESVYIFRLYGSVLIGYAGLYRNLMKTRERTNINMCLKTSAIVYGLQICASVIQLCTHFGSISFQKFSLLYFFVRLIAACGSLLFLELFDSSSFLSRWVRQFQMHQNDMIDRSPSPRHGSSEDVLSVIETVSKYD